MAINEESRHELHVRLEELLGPKLAATVMARLLPVEWGDVATRRDLEVREVRLIGEMDRRFGEVDRRFGEVDRQLGELQRQAAEWGRTVIYANLGAVLATASLPFAAAKLA